MSEEQPFEIDVNTKFTLEPQEKMYLVQDILRISGKLEVPFHLLKFDDLLEANERFRQRLEVKLRRNPGLKSHADQIKSNMRELVNIFTTRLDDIDDTNAEKDAIRYHEELKRLLSELLDISKKTASKPNPYDDPRY